MVCPHEYLRIRSMWASVVIAVLDDAVKDYNKYGERAVLALRQWAASRDGAQVLTNAGIDPNPLVVERLAEFVRRGERASRAMADKRDQQQSYRLGKSKTPPPPPPKLQRPSAV